METGALWLEGGVQTPELFENKGKGGLQGDFCAEVETPILWPPDANN